MSSTPSQNTLCRDLGLHDWRSSAASNFRVCSRANCHAVQIYQHGSWRDVPSRSNGKQRTLSPVQPEQAGLLRQ